MKGYGVLILAITAASVAAQAPVIQPVPSAASLAPVAQPAPLVFTLVAAPSPPAPTTGVQDLPISLDLEPPPTDEEVYSAAPPTKPGEGINEGGVNNDLSLTYFNHYIYRGVDHSITASTGTPNTQKSKANSLNLEINDRLEFNLGHLPHPFVGVFANIYDADPKSRFQEIRPFYGATWNLRPFDLEGGGNSYFYPQREHRDTVEVYGKITYDDSLIFNTEQPIFSPYFYAAYDYHRSNGWYFEAGISHQIPLEDFGVTLNFQGDVAYIMGYNQQFVFSDTVHDTGFQHYDAGVTASYSLTRLLSIPPNYGDLNLVGYLFYTGKINSQLRADNVLWGGVGIEFKY